MINFYPNETELVQIAYGLFSSFGCWIKGENMDHSMLRVVYLHAPVVDHLIMLFRSIPESDQSEGVTHLSVLLNLVVHYIGLLVNLRSRILEENILGVELCAPCDCSLTNLT